MIIESESSSPASSLSEEEEFQHVARTTAAGIVNGPRYAVTAGVVAAAAAAENTESRNRNTDGNGSSSLDEFVVVTDDDNNGSQSADQPEEQQLAEEELAAIEEWKKSRRENELQQLHDWEESLYQVPAEIKANHAMMTRPPTANANNDPQSRSWWQRNGEVAVLKELPTKLIDGSVIVNRIATLPPGLTIVATDLIELNSTTLLPKGSSHRRSQRSSATTNPTNVSIPPTNPNQQRSFSQGRVGIIQMIKLETRENQTGYACLSLDGYPLLGPGLPDAYVNPGAGGSHPANGSWIWRVTCPSGAFVREGLDLRTRHIRTLPYGSLVRVTRRCINDQGLSRLRTTGSFDVQAALPDSGSTSDEVSRVRVDGWCSELLNPLSGQRGIVAQPLPFPVPAIYRVTLSMGAVIRQDVELSSPQTGLAPFGSTVKIVARAFSEHPVDKCIERLKLAGDGGWISVRLNLPPPRDDLVVELVTIDRDFDPENPGVYHLNAKKAVRAERERERAENSNTHHPSDLSSIDENELAHDIEDDDCGDNESKPKCTVAQSGSTRDDVSKCVVCLTSDRNATIVHGETGHVVCCLVCARILKARGDKCPVCRNEIEKVIQHFYA